MNSAWLFILASIIAVIGILTAYKKLIAAIQHELDEDNWSNTSLQKAYIRFFINLAIVEIVPIILIALGFAQTSITDIEATTRIIGTIVIIGILIFGIVNTLVATGDLNKSEAIKHEDKASLGPLPFIGIGTLASIPVISLIGLYL